MTNQENPIVAPGIVEQLMRAHHKIVTELQAEIKTLKFDLSMATSAGDLAKKDADSWFAAREEYWGRAQSAEKDLSDVQDELAKSRNELAHANVQVERAERELVDAKKKLFKEDQQVESLLEHIADMDTDLLQLKQGVREAMAGSEGSYALMMEAFRKIRFLVASDKTYVPEGPAIPAENLFLNGNLKLVAGRSGAGVVLEDSQGRCIKITANKLKPIGEYLLAVHYFNEAGGNDNV